MRKVTAMALAAGGALVLAAGIWVGLPYAAQANQGTALNSQPVTQESQPATVEQAGTGVTATDATTTTTVSEVAAIVRPGGATLLDRPNGTAVETLQGGDDLTLIGKITDGSFYIVQSDAGMRFVATSEVIAPGAENLAAGFGGRPGGQGFPGGNGATMPFTGTLPFTGTMPIDAGGMMTGTFPGGGPVGGTSVSGASASTETTEVATTPVVINTAGETTNGSGTAVLNTLFNATSQNAMPPEITPAIVRSSGVTLDTAPGAGDGAVLGRGAMLNVTGTSEDGAYLQVETTSTPVQTGWVALNGVIYTGVRIGENLGEDVTASIATATESVPSATVHPANATATAVSIEATATTSAAPGATTETASATNALAGFGTVTVASGTSRLNVRSAPGTANAIVGKGEPGAPLTLLGKTADGTWLQVTTGEGITGWVAAPYVMGETSAAPILDEPVTDAAPAASAPIDSTGTAAAGAAAVSASGEGVTGLTGTIVYQTSPGGTFYAYNLETGAQTALTSGWDPAISPDGKTVAFVRGGGDNGIWLIDIDGSNERLIYGERRDLSSPKWSPDGTYIVFGRGDSYITCRQIGRECLPDEVWLDRNPNMDLDAFPLVDEYLQRIARIDKEGNNYRDIASLDSGREPDWSSEGIVYASSDGLQLTDDTEDAVNQVVYFEPLQARDQDPDWAGGRLVFVTKQSSHYQIFSVNPDGTGKTSLTKPTITLVDQIPSNVAPVYSPDGQHILFLSNRQADNEAGAWHIWVMDADGSNQRQLPIDAAIEYDFNHMEQALSWGA